MVDVLVVDEVVVVLFRPVAPPGAPVAIVVALVVDAVAPADVVTAPVDDAVALVAVVVADVVAVAAEAPVVVDSVVVMVDVDWALLVEVPWAGFGSSFLAGGLLSFIL